MAAPPQDASLLIVDDDELSRLLLQTQLRLAGYHRLAIAVAMPDAILLDVMMPGMDGYEVTRYIRSAYPGQYVPIILVSALETPRDRARGLEAGANDFISKPVDAQELVARIQVQLALKQARDDLQREREHMALLYDISRALAAQIDYDRLLGEIASLTTSLTGADKTLLIPLAEDGGFQEPIVAQAGENRSAPQAIDPHVLAEGLVGWVAAHRQPAVIPDVQQDPRWLQQAGQDSSARSAAAVPLMRGQVVGVLLMISSQPDAFRTDQINLLTAVGVQAAVALENARLYRAAREQHARAEAILGQTGDPVLVVDTAGHVTRINPAAERTLSLDAATIGRPVGDLFGARLADLVSRARERRSAVSGEHTLPAPGAGAPRTFNISVSPVEELGFVLVWQDITAIKEADRVRLEGARAETRRIFEALSRYMSPALVERVLGDPDILTRRERRQALVLFADLRGFTRLTVEHAPDDVITLLNDAFAEMMEIVYQHEGVVFDIAGDELMIAFNVPYSQPDARRRALATAIAMQRRFRELKPAWAARGMDVGMGIGINEGQVVLGHVGGRARMNYAMVGQAVSLAHRLVELAGDGQIVVAPEVVAGGLPDAPQLSVRELPPRALKGAEQPQAMVLLELEG